MSSLRQTLAEASIAMHRTADLLDRLEQSEDVVITQLLRANTHISTSLELLMLCQETRAHSRTLPDGFQRVREQLTRLEQDIVDRRRRLADSPYEHGHLVLIRDDEE